jgi:hypothetical protein
MLSIVKRDSGSYVLSKERFLKEKAAFIVKKIGIFAFRGKEPDGS